jgi:hypothetical protein
MFSFYEVFTLINAAASSSSEISIYSYQVTRRHIPEDSHRHENLNPDILLPHP